MTTPSTMTSPRRRRHPFTLIEIMIVVVILGLLAGLVGPKVLRNLDRAKIKTANAQANILKNCIKEYYMDMDAFPTTWAEMTANKQSGSGSKYDGPYLDPPQAPLDPWGKEYSFECKKEDHSVRVWSWGPDGQSGTGDDCTGETNPQK